MTNVVQFPGDVAEQLLKHHCSGIGQKLPEILKGISEGCIQILGFLGDAAAFEHGKILLVVLGHF
jgi:hypothetical protein